MKKNVFSIAAVLLVVAAVARAHPTALTSIGTANATQEINFGVSHGEDDADTYSMRMQIPASVASVRPTTELGATTIEKDATGAVTAITWQRPDSTLLPSDYAYYKYLVRMRMPNAPFTTVFFPTRQICKHLDGGTNTTDWYGMTAADTDAGIEPAPFVRLVPAHKAGWNKFTVPVAVTDLAGYFADAQIVWKGTSAFSTNAATVEQISNTSGVSALTALAAGDEIWVKY